MPKVKKRHTYVYTPARVYGLDFDKRKTRNPSFGKFGKRQESLFDKTATLVCVYLCEGTDQCNVFPSVLA